MSCFQLLPSELWVSVLQHLPALDVVRFQRVCTSFVRLVQESVVLRYKIACFLAGVEDGPSDSRSSTRERLDRLEAWRSMWKRPVWRDERVFPPVPSLFCVSGPAFALEPALSEPFTAIEFHVTSGKQRGVEARSWTLYALPELQDFTFDYYQDLLVVAESCPEGDELVVHLLSCSTGKPYPSVAQNTLRVTPPDADPLCTVNLLVCGELLVVEYTYEDLFHKITVFNWRQGSLLLHLDEDLEEYDGSLIAQGCAFLDDRYLLIVANGLNGVGVLAVFDCRAPTSNDRLSFQDALYAHASLVLVLPRVRNEISADPMLSISCAPASPRALPAQLTGTAFRAAAPPVVLVEISTPDTACADTLYNLLVPGRFLLSQLADRHAGGPAAAPRQLPWQAYAHECRMFRNAPTFHGCVHGARYMRGAQAAGWPSTTVEIAHVYDFGEPAALHAYPDEDCDADLVTHAHRVFAPSDASNANVWAEDITTAAPYLETRTQLAYLDGKAFFLVEDGLVVADVDGGTLAFTF